MAAAAPFIKVGIAVAAVGAQIAMSATQKTEGPRLGDLSVSAATYGLGIVKGWGVARLGGNMIWSSGIKERKSSHKGGKSKGTQVTYTYYASFAFAFAAGPCDRILKMWADSKPFYDETAGVYSIPGVTIRQYFGDESQLPDAAIEADKGAGHVPGFRGLVYVVFENVPLTPFGNRIPSISAEIAFSGQSATTLTFETLAIPAADNPFTSGTFSESLITNGWAVDWQRNTFYAVADGTSATDGSPLFGVVITDVPTMQKSRLVTVDQMYAGTGFSEPTAPAAGHFYGELLSLDCGNGLDLFLVITTDDGLPTSALCVRVNQDSMKVTGQCAIFQVGLFGISGCVNRGFDVSGNVIPWVAYNGGNKVYLVDGYAMNYKGIVLTGNFSDTNFTHLIPGAQNDDGSCDFWFIQTSILDGPTHNYVDLWKLTLDIYGNVITTLVNTVNGGLIAVGADYVTIQRADYDRANAALLLWVKYGATSGAAEFTGSTILVSLNPGTGLANWSVGGVTGTDDKGYSLIDGNRFGFVDNTGHVRLLDTRTGTSIISKSLTNADTSFFGSVFSSRLQASVSWDAGVSLELIKYDQGAGDPAILGDIVRDICVETGLTADDVDVTSLTDSVRGYTHTQEVARQLIADLASAFFFDGAESDYILKFVKRGGASVLTVPYADLVPPGNNGAALPVTRNQAETIARRVWIRYPDTDHDQQQGTQHANRSQAPDSVSVINSAGEETLDTRIVYNASEAKSVALKRLMMLWAERSTLDSVGLKPYYMTLDPMDIITVTTRDESTSRVRIERTALGADLAVQISGTIEDQTLTDLSATADGGSGLTNPPLVPTSYSPVVVQPEMPLIRDTDDTHQLSLRQYGAMGAYSGQSFGGASLYTSADNATWTPLFTSQTSMSWGYAINPLPPPAAMWTTDNVNHLDVSMVSGGSNLETVTSDQILHDYNPAILITATGAVEVLQFTTVTPLSTNTYRLTGLIRGRRGTEWVCGLHGAGDRFVLLDTDAWGMNNVALSWLNLTRYDKLLGAWDSLDAVPTSQRTYAGTAEKPYAPTYIQGAWDGSSNLTITWQRRDRITAEWRDLTENIPLNEASESYSIDILDGGGAVVRTLTSATNSVVYLNADQVTDGLSSPFSVAVYQISALVGRGYPGYATLTDTGAPTPGPAGAVVIEAVSASDSWSATGGHSVNTIVEAAHATDTVSSTGGIILASVTSSASATDTVSASLPSIGGGGGGSVPMQAKGLYYLASPPDVATVAANATSYDVKVIEPSTDGGVGNTIVSTSQVNQMRGGHGIVLAYMDIGANEPGRYWFDTVRAAGVSGLTPDEWGEYPIRFWDPVWYSTVQGYIDKAMASGFDGMYWDVVDNWQSSFVGGATSTNAQHMIQFMYDMRQYAAVTKGRPDFLFWANGAEELMDYGSFPTIGSYVDRMDGFYKEEVLYAASGNTVSATSSGDRTTEHTYFGQAVTAGKPVVLIEYCGNGTGAGSTCPGSSSNTVTITGGVAAAIADVKATTASWNMGYFVAHANYPTPPLDFVDTEGL